MDEQRKNDNFKEIVESCVEAPRLREVLTAHFIEFKNLREVYEKQIEEKIGI